MCDARIITFTCIILFEPLIALYGYLFYLFSQNFSQSLKMLTLAIGLHLKKHEILFGSGCFEIVNAITFVYLIVAHSADKHYILYHKADVKHAVGNIFSLTLVFLFRLQQQADNTRRNNNIRS